MSLSELAYGVVIYTDGSARPNPGYHGWGLHGYTYRLPEDSEKPTKVNALTATTEGYVLTNDLEKSSGQPVVVLSYLDCFQSSAKPGSNNIAEINAISLFFDEFPKEAAEIKKLHIVADSQYAINGATKWTHGWIKNNWIKSDGTEVSNRAEWEHLADHLKRFQQNAEFTMSWTHGHNGDFGNVKADYLSSIGTNYSTDGIEQVYKTISDPKGYHKNDEDIHPLLSFKRLYFNTDAEYNSPGQYFQSSWSGGADYIHGKRSSEAAFSVVRLKTPDPIVESLIKTQETTPRDFNTVVYAKIDRLRSQDVIPWLAKFGRYAMIPDKRCMNINFVDFKPLTIEVSAGELPLRTFDVLNHMEEMLSLFEQQCSESHDSSVFSHPLYQLHDITDHFYTTVEKKVGKQTIEKTELNKSIVNNMKETAITVTVPVRDEAVALTLPLIFSDDMPSRNAFKHLEALRPQVYCITWMESTQMLRYATILKTEDAVSIWSNYFANQLVV